MTHEQFMMLIGATICAGFLFAVWHWVKHLSMTIVKKGCHEIGHDSLVTISMQPTPDKSHTFILYRCPRCEQRLVTALPGQWDLETLTKDRSEVAEFNRIVRL